MVIRLEKQLEASGCDIDADEFRRILREVKDSERFAAMTDEEIICHTETQAVAFIAEVRKRCSASKKQLPAALINKALLVPRKRKKVAAAD